MIRRHFLSIVAALMAAAIVVPAAMAQQPSDGLATVLARSTELQQGFSTARDRVASIGEVFPELEAPLTTIINREKRARSAELRTEFADISINLAAEVALGDDQAETVSRVFFDRVPERTVAMDTPPLQIEDGVTVAALPLGGGVPCPVAGPVSFVNDWGWPRSGGRVHRGNDMFGSIGTPLVATEAGTLVRVDRTDSYRPGSSFDLGGRSITFLADSGTRWYYAHLNSVAAGLSAGVTVRQGQVLGTLGRSGNARSTPPHLHIQMHPGNGNAQNPYPVMAAACQ